MNLLLQLRQQFQEFWKRQSQIQRIVLISLLVAGAAIITVFIVWSNSPTYGVAFSGLTETEAGKIVEKLTAATIPYQVRNGTTIMVPTNRVYEVRLSMATQGLPAAGSGTVGYELFSGTTLGMTEFTQKVNYQRALEGELERTIGSLRSVQTVRVHIVTPEKALLTSEQDLTTASVTLEVKPGEIMGAAQVRAIVHLLASSVQGLKPENVVVVDAEGNMLASGNADGSDLAGQSDLQRRVAESAYAADTQKKVRNLLNTVLGPNNAVVQVTAQLDWTQRDITTQSVAPDTSAIRSRQTVTETYSGDGTPIGGIPGASSNLPPLTSSTSVSGTQVANYQRYEATTNFEFTQASTHDIVAPGSLQRLSVAVMVDLTSTQMITPLRSAIAAAAGINLARGDTLAVEPLTFNRTYATQEAAQIESDTMIDLYLKVGAVVGAVILLLILLWYIQRLLANVRLASNEVWTPVMLAAAEAAEAAAETAATKAAQSTVTAALEASVARAVEASMSKVVDEAVTKAVQSIPAPVMMTSLPAAASVPAATPAEAVGVDLGALDELEVPTAPPPVSVSMRSAPTVAEPMSAEDEQIQRRITQLAEEEPTAIADIIHMWLSEDERRNV
jgi:flagellar M-ring protein FliF